MEQVTFINNIHSLNDTIQRNVRYLFQGPQPSSVQAVLSVEVISCHFHPQGPVVTAMKAVGNGALLEGLYNYH